MCDLDEMCPGSAGTTVEKRREKSDTAASMCGAYHAGGVVSASMLPLQRRAVGCFVAELSRVASRRLYDQHRAA